MDRIDEVTKDCFNALAQIRQLDPQMQPPAEVLHSRMRAFIDTMIHRAGEAGFSREDVQDIAYAIVALTDELALSLPGNVRQHWMSRPLQLHYFNENVAGEGFFQRLEQIRLDPRRVEVLRVFYLCLMFGFQGRYRIRGGEVELAAINDTIYQDLQRARALGSETLSPQGARPAEAQAGAARELPVVAASIVAVLLAVGLYVGLRVMLNSDTQTVVQHIQTLNRQ